MKKVVIIAGLLVTAGLLTAHFVRQAKLLQKTCFNFGGYKILTLNKEKITIEIYLNLLNRSDIAITLKSYNLSVFLNNAKAVTLNSNTAQYIDRGGFTPIKLVVDFVPKDVLNFNTLSTVLLNFNGILVKIQGSISINAAGVPKTVPVLIENKLKDMLPTSPSQPCQI